MDGFKRKNKCRDQKSFNFIIPKQIKKKNISIYSGVYFPKGFKKFKHRIKNSKKSQNAKKQILLTPKPLLILCRSLKRPCRSVKRPCRSQTNTLHSICEQKRDIFEVILQYHSGITKALLGECQAMPRMCHRPGHSLRTGQLPGKL